MRFFLTTILALTFGLNAYGFDEPTTLIRLAQARQRVQTRQRPQAQPQQQQRVQQQPRVQPQVQYYYRPQQQQYWYQPQVSRTLQYRPQQRQQFVPAQQVRVVPGQQQLQFAPGQQQAQFAPRQQLYYRYQLANGQVGVVPLQNRPTAQPGTQQNWYREPSTGLYFSVAAQHRFVAQSQNVPRPLGPQPGLQTQSAVVNQLQPVAPGSGPALGPVPTPSTPEEAVVQTDAPAEESGSNVVPASATEPEVDEGPSLTPLTPVAEPTDTPPALPTLQVP